LKTGPGAFISHYDFGKKYLDNRVPHPLADNTNLRFVDILTDEKTYKGDS